MPAPRQRMIKALLQTRLLMVSMTLSIMAGNIRQTGGCNEQKLKKRTYLYARLVGQLRLGSIFEPFQKVRSPPLYIVVLNNLKQTPDADLPFAFIHRECGKQA